MTSKLSRFLHLERARTGRPEGESSSPVQSGGRFEAPDEQGKAPHETAVPDAHLERFRAQPPVPLADAPEGDVRRFPRCMLCESENGRFVQACAVCGADLGTPEQLEFNERLWQERKKGLSRTHEDETEALRQHEAQRQGPSGTRAGAAEALRQHEAQRQGPSGTRADAAEAPPQPGVKRTHLEEVGAQRREDAEHFARQLAQLRAEEGTHWWIRAFSQHSTVGTALLSLLPHPAAKLLALAVLIVLPLGLWRYGQGLTRLGGLGLGIFFLALFVPPKALRRY